MKIWRYKLKSNSTLFQRLYKKVTNKMFFRTKPTFGVKTVSMSGEVWRLSRHSGNKTKCQIIIIIFTSMRLHFAHTHEKHFNSYWKTNNPKWRHNIMVLINWLLYYWYKLAWERTALDWPGSPKRHKLNYKKIAQITFLCKEKL